MESSHTKNTHRPIDFNHNYLYLSIVNERTHKMKEFIYYILFLSLPLLAGIQASAQCDPDTTCTDTNNEGAFCPDTLPNMNVGDPYEVVLTVIPPSGFEFEGNQLSIAYIEIDSVLNFPPGITYSPSAGRFYADTAYCVLISGTPTQTGTFPLNLYVTPYIEVPLFGIIKGPQTIDSTSVVLTVDNVTSSEFPIAEQFEVFQNVPNPFSQSTRIGFHTPTRDNIKLRVYSIIGELIYEESRQVLPGEHFFNFDGSGLLAGSYLYLVTSSSSHQAKKLIKSR